MVFGYQMNPFGEWVPFKAETAPRAKTSDGAVRKQIIMLDPLPVHEEDLSLEFLAQSYPVPAGDFPSTKFLDPQ